MRKFLVAFVILGVLGFADATYLTIEKLTAGTIPCFITTGCDAVNNSEYSTIAGIPVSAFGMAYYVIILLGSIQILLSRQYAYVRFIAWLTVAGLAFTLYLLYLMQFVLQAYCFYCLISAATSTTLFIIGLLARKHIKHQTYG